MRQRNLFRVFSTEALQRENNDYVLVAMNGSVVASWGARGPC